MKLQVLILATAFWFSSLASAEIIGTIDLRSRHTPRAIDMLYFDRVEVLFNEAYSLLEWDGDEKHGCQGVEIIDEYSRASLRPLFAEGSGFKQCAVDVTTPTGCTQKVTLYLSNE